VLVRKPTRLQTPRQAASRHGAARRPGPRHLLRLAAILLQKVSILHGNGNSSPYIGNLTGIPSPCIPSLGLQDGPAGAGDGLGGVTQMPSGNASAATFDPAYEQQYAAAAGRSAGTRTVTVTGKSAAGAFTTITFIWTVA
jgi:hypothetical protein